METELELRTPWCVRKHVAVRPAALLLCYGVIKPSTRGANEYCRKLALLEPISMEYCMLCCGKYLLWNRLTVETGPE